MAEVVIRVEGLALHAYHGLDEAERRDGGPFELSLEARYPEPLDATRDDLAGRPDYAALARRAAEFFTRERFGVIEPLAARIAERLLAEFDALSEVTVRVRKLRPAMPTALRHVEVEVTRRRG